MLDKKVAAVKEFARFHKYDIVRKVSVNKYGFVCKECKLLLPTFITPPIADPAEVKNALLNDITAHAQTCTSIEDI